MKIQLNNSTPFVPLQFESIDARRNHFGVVVLGGSFKIENKKRLSLAETQESLVLEDTYFEDPGNSSLRFDSNLSPYKPKTDLLIEATAFSPTKRKMPEWISEVDFGSKKKQFKVTGPRQWEGFLGLRSPSAPEPISKLDVRYEYAFGGKRPDGTEFQANPVGVGFDRTLGSKCPQIVPVDADVNHETIPVVGLGPISPSWESRLRFAGSYNDEWQRTRAPYLPADFDFEFYNVAPNDQKIAGFAKGDEVVRLKNLYSKGDLAFGLPDIQIGAVLRFSDGRIIPGPMNLDTIQVQVEQQRVFLQWRGIFPATLPIKEIDLRLSAPQYLVAA